MLVNQVGHMSEATPETTERQRKYHSEIHNMGSLPNFVSTSDIYIRPISNLSLVTLGKYSNFSHILPPAKSETSISTVSTPLEENENL